MIRRCRSIFLFIYILFDHLLCRLEETSDSDSSDADNSWFEMIHTTASWDNFGGYLLESGLDEGSGSDSEVGVSSGSGFEVGISSLDINLEVDTSPPDIDFEVDARSLDIDFEVDVRSLDINFNMGLQVDVDLGFGLIEDPTTMSVHSFGPGSSHYDPSPETPPFNHVHNHTPPGILVS